MEPFDQVFPSGGGGPLVLPAGLRGGGVWDEIERLLVAVEAPGSTRSLLLDVVGDSKDEMHRGRSFPADSWPAMFNLLLQDRGRPGGARKHVEFDRLATYLPQVRLDGGRVAEDVVLSPGGEGTGPAQLKIAPEGTAARWYPDGLTAATLVLDPAGAANSQLRVDVFSGNRTGQGQNAVPVPGAGETGDLAAYYTGGDVFVADWRTEEYHPGRLHVDAQGVPFGTDRRVYVPVASGMDLGAQGAGCTIVIRAVGQTEQRAYALLTQRGGSVRNYLAALNVAQHSSTTFPYIDPTPTTTYAPSQTNGGDKRFIEIYRNRGDFQHAGWAGITHAPTDVATIWGLYTNDDITTNAMADARVAEYAAVRDEHLAFAKPFPFVFHFKPVTVNQTGAVWQRFKALVKTEMESKPLSGWADSQVISGLTRGELLNNYPARGYGGDDIHEGRNVNLVTAIAMARCVLGRRWLR